MTIERFLEDFSILDTWEDRYAYLIELGERLTPLPPEYKTEEHKVQGCISQVWLMSDVRVDAEGKSILHLRGDSDALITRGLLALLIGITSEQPLDEILKLDIKGFFQKLDLEANLSPQRSNGLYAVIERIKKEAQSLSEKISDPRRPEELPNQR